MGWEDCPWCKGTGVRTWIDYMGNKTPWEQYGMDKDTWVEMYDATITWKTVSRPGHYSAYLVDEMVVTWPCLTGPCQN